MIEGIEIFERIEVYGKQTPSDATILIILFELKKTGNKNDMTNANSAISQKFSNFLDTSNLAIKHTRALFNNDCIKFTISVNMDLNYKNNYQLQCELVGVSFPLLWQSFATATWFASVMNYLEIPNQSDMSKDMIKHVNTFKKTGAYVRDSKYTDDKNNLIRFKEYREAISFIYEFISGTSELSKNNQQMKELLIQRDNILREIAGIFHRRYGKDYNPVIDGWGHLLELNQQGYGVYFVVGHGGEKNNDITHGSTLFHESDRATLEQQQVEIDRISSEFGKPTAVVKTKKSLHAYWASTETIPVEHLATYQRRWLQFSNCDDSSLSDPAQLMRLPGFDHVAWNLETNDFDRIECKLLQLNEVRYSLEQFDRILPPLDVDRFCQKSLEIIESDADDRDMRTLSQYLPGYDNSGKWIKAKCPAHGGESSDSLHIDSETGGFICHAGCSSSSVYNASKAVAVRNGHRFEAVSIDADEDLKDSITKALDLKSCEAPNLYGGSNLGKLFTQTARNFNERLEIFNFISIPVLASRIKAETSLLVNPGSGFVVKPVRWCGLVGGTGTMKSPILNTVVRPLNHQQTAIWKQHLIDTELHDEAFRAYDKLSKDEKKSTDEPLSPKQMQSVYFSDFTIEALTAAISEYPEEGTVIYSDELAGFFSSMDAYKSTAGVDRPKWLSIWDGGAIKSTRRSGSTYVPHSSISIIGGIQPGIIASMIITVEKIEGNIVCGRTDDDSYIGGSIDSVRSVSTDELPTNGEIERVPLGNGMVEIVRQQPTEIIDGVEVEYEC